MFLLFWWACGQNEPAASAAAETTGIGATNIAEIDEWTAKIAQSPDDPALYAARAEAFFKNEGYDEAIRDMAAAISIDSTNVGYHHTLSDIYLRYFKSRLALQTMERAVALAPEEESSLLKLAQLQYTLKLYDESLKTIDRVFRVDPQNAEAFFITGLNFAEKEASTAAAITAFQKAVDLDPDMVDAWISLGRLYARLGNSRAIQFFDSAIKVAPRNPVAYHAKADYLRDQDDLNGAIALYKTLNTHDHRYVDGFFNAGLLYMELDSVEQAYKQFDLVNKVSVTHVKAYYFKGLAAERLGRADEARALYEQALIFAPEYDLPQEGLARLRAQ